jgi:hypothetical protein
MAEKVQAMIMIPWTSLHFGEAALFADAGGKMNKSLMAARDHYVSAQGWLENHGRMARAAIKGLELRLRELGNAGEIDMSDNEVRLSSLDEFHFPR